MQVESAVPRGGDEDAVRFAVYDATDGSSVLAQGSQFSSFKIEAMIPLSAMILVLVIVWLE